MDFVNVRRDFTVYVVDSETSCCDMISEGLKGAGYHVESFMKGEDVITEIQKRPPHIIILGTYLLGMTGLQLVKAIRELSPDIQLIIMANYAESEIASEALAFGATDRIYKPIQNIADLITAVDRNAERRFLEFSNEALYNKLTSSKAAQRQLRRRFVHERKLNLVAKKLLVQMKGRTSSEALDIFVKSISSELSDAPVHFFRYLPVQDQFVCTHESSGGLNGASLNIKLETFTNEPESIRDILTVLLSQNHFDYRLVEVSQKVLGVLVIGQSLNDPVVKNSIEHAVEIFELQFELLEAKKRLFETSLKDEQTGAWTKTEFQTRITQEISRARRLQMPVSMLYLGIDKSDEIKNSVGPVAFGAMVEKLVTLLQRTSRATDIIGRYAESEFAVLLPHTDRMGAAIKAEKFRRLVERSEFLNGVNIRTSIGISEYPSLCLDADGLWNAADSAYFQIKKVGNKVCLTAVPKGFEPDFHVQRG